MKIGALLLTIGLVIMGAEVWLAVTWPILTVLSIVLFAMTAFTEYMVFTEWWEDLEFYRRQRRWARHRDRLMAKQKQT